MSEAGRLPGIPKKSFMGPSYQRGAWPAVTLRTSEISVIRTQLQDQGAAEDASLMQAQCPKSHRYWQNWHTLDGLPVQALA